MTEGDKTLAQTYRQKRWMLTFFIAGVVINLGFVFYKSSLEPHFEALKLDAVVRNLAKHQPLSMTNEQWAIAVGWTTNLHCNSLVSHADAVAIRSLREQLQKRMENEVGMETIGWIWDSYAKLTTAGRRYQRFRHDMVDAVANNEGDTQQRLQLP